MFAKHSNTVDSCRSHDFLSYFFSCNVFSFFLFFFLYFFGFRILVMDFYCFFFFSFEFVVNFTICWKDKSSKSQNSKINLRVHYYFLGWLFNSLLFIIFIISSNYFLCILILKFYDEEEENNIKKLLLIFNVT